MGLKRLNDKNSEYLLKHPDAFYTRYIRLTPYYAKAGKKKKAIMIWLECVKRSPVTVINNIKSLAVIIVEKKDNELNIPD